MHAYISELWNYFVQFLLHRLFLRSNTTQVYRIGIFSLSGTWRGQPCPMDTFFWIVHATIRVSIML